MIEDNDIFEMKRQSPDKETFETKTICTTWKALWSKIFSEIDIIFARKGQLSDIKKSVESLLSEHNKLLQEKINALETKCTDVEQECSKLRKEFGDLRNKINAEETGNHNSYVTAIRELNNIVGNNLPGFFRLLPIEKDNQLSVFYQDLLKCICGQKSTSDIWQVIPNMRFSDSTSSKINELLTKIDKFNNNYKKNIIDYLEKKGLGSFDRFVYTPGQQIFDSVKCESWYCTPELVHGDSYDYVITPYVGLPDFPDIGKQEILKAKVTNKIK